jgi:hypothetical protein
MAIAVAALALPACSHTISGTATTKLTPLDAVIDGVTPADRVPADDPLEGFLPNGGRIATEPRPSRSQPLPTTPDAAVKAVVQFWRGKNMPLTVRVQEAEAPLVCDAQVHPNTPAMQCDTVVLVDEAWVKNTPLTSIEFAMAHEVGHHILRELGWSGDLESAPRIGTEMRSELASDCLAGVYEKSTGMSTNDLDAAVRGTGVPFSPVRMEAVHAGLDVTDPMQCIDRVAP